jgi:hypothetical protein
MSLKRLTPDTWQRHIRSWQQSGLSQKAYCQQHQLGLSTFHSKYRELKSEMVTPSAKPLLGCLPWTGLASSDEGRRYARQKALSLVVARAFEDNPNSQAAPLIKTENKFLL